MPLAGGADESGEVQRRLMFFRAAAEMRPDAVTRFFLSRAPTVAAATTCDWRSRCCTAQQRQEGLPSHSRTARHTPSVVMQALGARTAIAAPAAKLNARPTTRKVRAIPEREPPKPVSPDPSLIVPNAR